MRVRALIGLLAMAAGLASASGGCSTSKPSGDNSGLTYAQLTGVPDPLANLQFAAEDKMDGAGHKSGHFPNRWKFAPTLPSELEGVPIASGGLTPSGPQPSGTELALAQLDLLAANQLVTVGFTLRDDEGEIESLPDDDQARHDAVEDRKSALAPVQDAFVKAAASFGAVETARGWLVNFVSLRLSASAAKALAKNPLVAGVSLDAPGSAKQDNVLCGTALGGTNIGISGHQYRYGNRELYLPSGYNGDSGGRGGGRVRLALIETGDFLVRSHLAYRFSSPADRIVISKYCNAAICVTSTPAGTIGHANAVAQWAAGSVENGQDPNCVGLMGLHRSGTGSYGTQILFYTTEAGGCSAAHLAIEDAVANNADIINMSHNFEQTGCSPSFNCGNDINAAIRSATNAGALVVTGSGDDGWLPGCHSYCCMGNPATRPEVLTVGGLQTMSLTQDYNTYGLDGGSSWGGLVMSMNDGFTGIDSGVDLMGPWSVNFTGTSPTNYYANSYDTMAPGTSFSSPAIAGAGASVLDGFRSIGWYQNARTLRLNLLMMGDAAVGASTDKLDGMDVAWGAGRLHATVPVSGWATAPYWWGQSPFVLNPGVTAYGCVNGCNPMPSSVRQYNWVLYFEDADFVNVPVIKIEVVNLDTGAVIRASNNRSTTLRIQLRDSEIWGRRLQLRITPISMASATTVYSGDFYHSDAAGWTYH